MEAPFIRSARRRFWPSRDHDPSGARDLLECFKMERDGLGKRGIRLLGRDAPVVLFGRRWTWAWAPCNMQRAHEGREIRAGRADPERLVGREVGSDRNGGCRMGPGLVSNLPPTLPYPHSARDLRGLLFFRISGSFRSQLCSRRG